MLVGYILNKYLLLFILYFINYYLNFMFHEIHMLTKLFFCDKK